MDRQPHEYGPPMAYGQQQQQQMASMQPQYGFNAQHQQFGPSGHGGPPPFMQPHPSLQQFAYSRPMQQAQMYPHPPHTHFHQQGPPPPHSFPSHMPPHLMPSSFNGQQYEPAPAPPPSDPELQKRIDKLVEYAIKNGPEFEAIVREREQDNPAYGFLFGGEGHNYYRYKLFLATRPSMGLFNPSFPSSMPAMHTPPNPMMNLGPVNVHVQQQPPFGMYYDQQHPHPSQALVGLGRPEFDQAYSRPFKGLSRPLPSDVEMELNSILNNLTGTKESIKGAKTWFMQRSPFVPALAEVLRDRVFSLDDSERQLHIVYLANDILFDSLQRRVNPQEIDNEALAFKPVLGCMLARIYHNPQNKEENQSRLQKILQFWASKEVYDQDTIFRLENEMMSGLPPHPFPGPHTDSSAVPGAAPGMHQMSNHNPLLWPPADKHMPMPDQDYLEKQAPPIPLQQFHPTPPIPPPTFASALPPTIPQPTIPAAEKPPPYPLFPPGLIPGMVRKMQIGSGVPYSPMSPLDIPTVIPPSGVPPSQVLETVSKFFREIGEINPSVGPTDPSKSDDYDDGGGSYEYGGETPVRKGGACIPPPPGLNADPEGDDDWMPSSSERPGLGVTVTGDPDEPSQYDDVYSSYRKQRSSNYHTSMSARASAR